MITELVLVGIAWVGVVLKVFHFEGANLTLLLSLFLLSVWYFPLGFYSYSVNGLKKQPLALSIIGGMMLSSLVLAVLFAGLYWEGGIQMLLFGLPGSAGVLLAAFLLKKNQEEYDRYYRNLFIRTGFWMGVGLIMFILYFTPFMQTQQEEQIEQLQETIDSYEPKNLPDQTPDQ